MLAANSYDQSYIDARRARMEAQVAAYDAVVEATDGPAAGEALATFEGSVLGLAYGDEIRLDSAAFLRLSRAFLAEIEKRYA